MKCKDRVEPLSVFIYGQTLVSTLIFIYKNAVNVFPSFLRRIENRPPLFDLGRFEDASYQFSSAILVRDTIYMSHEILFLASFRIITEMTIYPVAYIICFSHVNDFALIIVKK